MNMTDVETLARNIWRGVNIVNKISVKFSLVIFIQLWNLLFINLASCHFLLQQFFGLFLFLDCLGLFLFFDFLYQMAAIAKFDLNLENHTYEEFKFSVVAYIFSLF